MGNDEKTAQFFDIISLNNQKGEFYRIKFINDDNIYTGIPVICATCRGEEPQFSMKITQPAEASGRTIKETITRIEYLKKL